MSRSENINFNQKQESDKVKASGSISTEGQAVISSANQQLIQRNVADSAVQISYLGFTLVVAIGTCLYLARWSHRHWTRKSLDYRRQRVESLEKIWKMNTYRKS